VIDTNLLTGTCDYYITMQSVLCCVPVFNGTNKFSYVVAAWKCRVILKLLNQRRFPP